MVLTDEEMRIARDAIRHSDYHGDEETEGLVRRYNRMVAVNAAQTPKRRWQLRAASAVNVSRNKGKPLSDAHRANLRAAWVKRKAREEAERKMS